MPIRAKWIAAAVSLVDRKPDGIAVDAHLIEDLIVEKYYIIQIVNPDNVAACTRRLSEIKKK